MNKWFYRAVGAVGVASGALLASSGVAHAVAADEAKPTVDPQAMRGLVADLFTPTGGPHHVGLSIDMPATTLPASAPADREEFLNGLFGGLGGGGPLGGLTGSLTGGGPLGGLTSSLTGGLGGDSGGLLGGLTGGDSGLLGGLTGGLDKGPLSGLTGGLTGGLLDGADDTDQTAGVDPAMLKDLLTDDQLAALTTQGPASTDVIDPALRGTDIDTTGSRPVQLDPDLARQFNAATGPMMSAMIADAVAQQMGIATGDQGLPAGSGDALTAGPVAVEEGLPIVSDLPLVGPLLGPEGPLGQFIVVGDFANKLPFVGDVLSGNLDPTDVGRLPVVGNLLNNGLLKSSGPSLPLVGSLPFVGDALTNLTGQATNGITQPSGPLGGLTQHQQARTLPAAAPAGQAQQPVARPAAPRHGSGDVAPARDITAADTTTPLHVGRHRATDRPEVSDPDLESGTLPLVGSLTGDKDVVGTLPLSTLMRNVPLISEVPLVGELGSPLGVLKSLPIVGTLAGLLPIESDTAA